MMKRTKAINQVVGTIADAGDSIAAGDLMIGVEADSEVGEVIVEVAEGLMTEADVVAEVVAVASTGAAEADLTGVVEVDSTEEDEADSTEEAVEATGEVAETVTLGEEIGEGSTKEVSMIGRALREAILKTRKSYLIK